MGACRKAKREIANRYPQTVEIPSDRVNPIHSGYSEVTFYASPELMQKLEEIQGLLAHSHSGIQIRQLVEVLADDFYERNHLVPKARRASEREEKKKVDEVASLSEAVSVLESPSAKQVDDDSVPAPISEVVSDIVVERRCHSQAIVHELIRSEGYECSYLDPVTHRKCESKFKLQKDHIQPWSKGGKTSLSNARYLCGAHHRRISYLEFGDAWRFFSKNRSKNSK